MTPDLTDAERLAIEAACARLIHRYAHLADHDGGAEMVDLFTDDAVVGGLGGDLEGRAAIAGFFGRPAEPGSRSQHVCNTILIDVESATSASGCTYLVMFQSGDAPDDGGPTRLRGPFAVGEYHDRFRRTDDGWRIAERQVKIRFIRMRST